MHSVRRLAVGLLVAVFSLAAAPDRATAQVLKQVPANSMVVVKVANLKATNAKIGALAQQLGIVQMVPTLADPMAALFAEMDFSKGLNKDGEFALCLIDPGPGQRMNAPPLVALFPVSDYAAFLTNFTEPKAEGDVTQVSMPSDSGPGYVTKWGDYAAVSPIKALVAKKPESAITAAGLTSKELETKDAVVYFNFPAIRAKALPELKKNRTQILNEITRGMNRNKQQRRYLPLAKAAVNHALDIAEGFLTNTQAATIGITFAPEGLKVTTMAEFVPESYPAQLISGIKSTDASLVAGLPSTKYLFFGGMALDPAVTTKAIDDLTAPITKELAAAGEDMKPIVTYIDAMKKVFASNSSTTFGVVAPTGQLGQESLFQSVSIATGDSKALAAAMKQALETQGDMTKLASPGIKSETTFTANAKTVDGIAFDQLKTSFTTGAKAKPEEMQVVQMMTMMYGPDGINAFVGPINDKKLLMVAGGNDALLTSAVASAKANQDNLSTLPQVKAVSANLPPNRFMAFYVPVDTLVSTGVTYAKQFGMPVNLQMPPNLPPIALTGTTEGNAIHVDYYIPSQLVQSLVAAGMQMFMAVQGGQPGQPGGL